MHLLRSWTSARRDVSRESVVGYAWASAIALATLIVALNPGGEMHDLDLLVGGPR